MPNKSYKYFKVNLLKGLKRRKWESVHSFGIFCRKSAHILSL